MLGFADYDNIIADGRRLGTVSSDSLDHDHVPIVVAIAADVDALSVRAAPTDSALRRL